jgi:pantetheine-phosphate adenylyltransferase
MKKIAVYPGSFDPITNGHIDIIERGLKVFDEIIVAVAINSDKRALFTVEERVEMVKIALKGRDKIKVDSFKGLLVDYMNRCNGNVIIKGLRAISDFEYEFQMAQMNRKLNEKIETFFMMTSETYSYLSSRIVKEIASLGGSVKNIVPDIVERRLKEKFKNINFEERYNILRDGYGYIGE